jgi:hypothetical protein
LPGDYLYVIQFYLEVAMKKMLRISVLSVLVLAALAFSAFGVMARSFTLGIGIPAASATDISSLKQEVIGTVTAIDATSITLDGTVYPLSATTQIQGVVQAGDTVKLEIVTNPDGSITVHEVDKPDSSDSSADVSETEPAGIDPISTVEPMSTEAASLDKSNSVDPASTVEPVHSEISNPDKDSSTSSNPDKGSPDSVSDKSGSSLDKNDKDAGNDSGHDTTSNASRPESVSAPTGDGQ